MTTYISWKSNFTFIIFINLFIIFHKNKESKNQRTSFAINSLNKTEAALCLVNLIFLTCILHLLNMEITYILKGTHTVLILLVKPWNSIGNHTVQVSEFVRWSSVFYHVFVFTVKKRCVLFIDIIEYTL